MPYGATDYSSIDRLRNAVADYSDREVQAAQSMAALRERASDKATAANTLQWFGSQDLSDTSKLPGIATKAGMMLGQSGGAASESAAKTIHEAIQTRLATERQEPNPQWVDRGGQPTFTSDIKAGDQPHVTQKAEWVVRNGKPVFSYPKEGDQPYEHPDKAAGREERVDLQKNKDQFNFFDQLVKAYESAHGAETLNGWSKELEQKAPNVVGKYLSIANNPDLSDEEKSKQYEDLGTGIDKELDQKLKIVGSYNSAKAKREGYRTNLHDRGYDVDVNGRMVRYRAGQSQTGAGNAGSKRDIPGF